MRLCNYGCGQEAKHQFKNGKWCCSKSWNSCLKLREKNSEKLSGSKNPMFGKKRPEISEWNKKNKKENQNLRGKKLGKQTKEHIGKRVSKIRGKERPDLKRKMLLGQAVWMLSLPRGIYKDHKDWMLNGGAVYMNSLIQNPSKLQVETWKNTCKVCPYVYLNYPVTHLKNSYSIDIAIPKLEIAIETDGSYWHQDKEKDLKRQLGIKTKKKT
jgi:hypothetical protein